VRSRTAESKSIGYSQWDGGYWRRLENHMLFIIGAVMALMAVVMIPRMRVPGGVNARTLGWMSEQWLAEHRASSSA